MIRREIIRRTILASGSAMISPSTYPEFLNTPLQEPFKGNVLIIGAGAAGLFAGHLLRSKGVAFQILEAADRYGGRLGKIEGFADFPLDRGAQWLHGKKSLIKGLIKQTRTKITKDRSDEFYWFQGQMQEKLPIDVADILEGDDSYPDISFRAYAREQGLGEEYDYIVEQIAGDYGADSSLLSVKWTAVEEQDWSSGNKDYKFRETYFDLIDRSIAKDITDSIRLNTIVESIDYREEQLIVRDRSGERYYGEKVIITVPIPVLQDGNIEFMPPLPPEQTAAFSKIGMGAGMKVFLKFRSRFYHENIAGGKVCAAYADERIGKKGKDHVLMAFVMGKQAERLTALGDDQAITAALLTELDEMYEGKASATFMDAHVENFTTNPFIRGAYSYSKVGIGNARTIAAQALANKIFFAGEAMNLNGHHQTVHGAMESALEQVTRLLQ